MSSESPAIAMSATRPAADGGPVKGVSERMPAISRVLIASCLLSLGCSAPGYARADDEPVREYIVDPDIPEGNELEEMGARIGRIFLDKENVFDISRKDEDRFLYRLANRWHIMTRDSVIRQQLLFREGDLYSERLAEESARILRRKGYLYTAVVEPLQYADGTVDVVVRTRDLWTLIPGISVSRSGGENKSRVSLSESNLLGRGARIRLSYMDDVDRESTNFEFSDENLGHSWLSFYLGLSDSSDGSTARLRAEKPFYALNTRRAWGLELLDDLREDRLYDLGEEIAEYRHESDDYTAFGGWSSGLQNGWVRRWTAGVVYDNQRFSEVPDPEPDLLTVVPRDRRLVYPFIELELLEDRYTTTANRDQIGRTEDFNLGRQLRATLGYASEELGSDRDSIIYSINASRGYGDINRKALILSAEASGRVDDGSSANSELGIGARYYNQITAKRLFFMTLDAHRGHNLDLDNPLEIGGDVGLRGYPLRYQSGDASVLFTIEQRYFTDWYPFRLARVGGAVFADVGRTWGDNPVQGSSLGWLRDVGFGLRLGPTRGGADEVLHIDIAFPLDGDPSIDKVQILLESKGSF
jgi:outer membrane protein assembly factor BamA